MGGGGGGGSAGGGGGGGRGGEGGGGEGGGGKCSLLPPTGFVLSSHLPINPNFGTAAQASLL